MEDRNEQKIRQDQNRRDQQSSQKKDERPCDSKNQQNN